MLEGIGGIVLGDPGLRCLALRIGEAASHAAFASMTPVGARRLPWVRPVRQTAMSSGQEDAPGDDHTRGSLGVDNFGGDQ
jgi:hypothetical protein